MKKNIMLLFAAVMIGQVAIAQPAIVETTNPAPVTVQAKPRPVAIPWEAVWVVKNPQLLPGLDYRINRQKEWAADVLKVYAKAEYEVLEAAAKLPAGTLWGVVLDVDDTILDHAVFNRMTDESGVNFSAELWRGWIEARKAGLLPGAKELIEKINEAGGKVILLSNLADYEEFHAQARLFELGIRKGTHYAAILTRAWGSQSSKPERQRVMDELIRLTDDKDDDSVPVIILGSFGDQSHDEMAGVPFYAIPQGSAEWGVYGKPAVGKLPERK